MQGPGVSDLNQWRRQLLEGVGLSIPDGRPLYAYRLNDALFLSLEIALKEKIARLRFLETLSQTCADFDPLFVLYASEWWRRRYNGSRWSWEPILSDLGADDKDWAPGKRGEAVSHGLRYWKLRAIQTGGLRYLGAIAVQGGLPMQLLSEARGNVGRMLRKVLSLAVAGADLQQVQGWIESLEDYLPKSYRREEIYVLLAEVIDIVLHLKNEAELAASDEAVDQLNERVPGWRKRFPLPVEDENIQGLVEQLIQDATAPRKARANISINLQRWLNIDGDIWSLSASVNMPDVLAASDILKTFSIQDVIELPRSLEIVLRAETKEQCYSARKIAGHDAYRLERSPSESSGEVAAAEHTMNLRTSEGQSWPAALCKGEALDSDLPWIFGDDSEQSPKFIRQGSGDIANARAIIVVPPGASINASEVGGYEMIAFLEQPEREIYSVQGSIVITLANGSRLTIRTDRADASDEIYQWHGDRVWLDFIKPNVAFRGRPRLCRAHGDEGLQRIQDEVFWSKSAGIYGPNKVCYEQKGELRHQAKIVLLPDDASVEYLPQNATSGIIWLKHWGVTNVTLVDTCEVEIQTKRDSNNLCLTCFALSEITPEWLELSLTWKNNADTAKIRLPFPAEGARAFDGNGQELRDGSWLSVQHLTGVRFISFCRPHIPVEVVFRLRHTKLRENAHELRRRIRPIAGTSRLEIRILDYIDEIQQLLASDELLDAWVEVGMYINNLPAISVRVSRYTCQLSRMKPHVLITSEHLDRLDPGQIDSIPIYALRLNHPAEEPIQLHCLKSQGVPNGAWQFDPADRPAGAWLIFPGKGSSIAFRPTLWFVDGESAANSALANALAIESRDTRSIALDEVIEEMAADFCHPGWQDMEDLAKQLGHLPLATLDVWSRFAHSPYAMAALALRMGNISDSFIQRFSLEQPFLWEIVPMQAWLNAAKQLERQAVEWFGADFGATQFKSHLNSQVKKISEFRPVLGKLLGIVKSVVLKDNCKEVSVMRNPESNEIFRLRLFANEGCALVRLFREHSEDTWPNDSRIFYAINGFKARKEFKHFFPQETYSFKDTVIGLPISLALQVVAGDVDDWVTRPELIYTLRTYINFDQEWFVEAFDLTIARCLSTNFIEI